jgi:sterol desaturase/sphingolipid hydroxylase (fatty acid hydroxylase superfamily)
MSNHGENVLGLSVENENVLKKKEQLSKVLSSGVQYWMGHVANWSMVLTLTTIAIFHSKELTTWQWFWVPASGLFLWTLAEYVFHRWGYHKNETFFAVGHTMHHDDPVALLGMPWIVNVILLSSATFLLIYAFGVSIAAASIFVASFWLGHIWYSIVHHGIHHWNFNFAWFRELKKHHKIHHKMPDKNLGVTTIFWDRLFRSRVQR